MIIVEGPDATGKTTLAKRLAADFDLEYMRPPEAVLSSTTGPTNMLPAWWTQQLRFQQHRHNHNDGRIYDRCFYISECIYQGAKAERRIMVDGEDLARGIHDLWVLDPIIIFCLPPWESQAGILYSNRAKLEGYSLAQLEKIAWVYWCYYGMWREMVRDCLVYDYTVDVYEQLAERVGDLLGLRAASS